MGGIKLSPQQQVRLAWLARNRNVSQEQVLSDIVDAYLGTAVPTFSAEERTKIEQELIAIARKSNKQLSDVKADILADKGHRYRLNDSRARSYHDYLTLTQ
jgi:hypothetical protein